MNGIWLLVGLGLGFGLGWFTRRPRSRGTQQLPAIADVNFPATEDHQSLQEQLHQTELAYQMATEMSQFKGGFLARTSHELRSPLNGLIGMHQLILSDLCENPAEERDFLTQAHDSALKMVKVLDQVIDVAKVEQGTSQLDIQPVQLTKLFEEIYLLTHLQAQNRNYPLRVASPAPDLYVLADPRRLKQAITSLIYTTIAVMADAGIREGAIAVLYPDSQPPEKIDLWLDLPLNPEDWSDPVHGIYPTRLEKLAIPASKQALIDQVNEPCPSPGFTLLMAHLLLQSMQGTLTLHPMPDAASGTAPATRICLTLPRLPLEADF